MLTLKHHVYREFAVVVGGEFVSDGCGVEVIIYSTMRSRFTQSLFCTHHPIWKLEKILTFENHWKNGDMTFRHRPWFRRLLFDIENCRIRFEFLTVRYYIINEFMVNLFVKGVADLGGRGWFNLGSRCSDSVVSTSMHDLVVSCPGNRVMHSASRSASRLMSRHEMKFFSTPGGYVSRKNVLRCVFELLRFRVIAGIIFSLRTSGQ